MADDKKDLPDPQEAEIIVATNPERIQFNLAEINGSGPADGTELLALHIAGYTDDDGNTHPCRIVVFSRDSARYAGIGMLNFLHRDERVREQEMSQEDEVNGD
jgi:hypothetical protein